MGCENWCVCLRPQGEVGGRRDGCSKNVGGHEHKGILFWLALVQKEMFQLQTLTWDPHKQGLISFNRKLMRG